MKSNLQPLKILSMLGPLLGLVVVFLFFWLLAGRLFVLPDNLVRMLSQSAVVAIAALGMTLIIISGGIDLSVGSLVALVGVVAAFSFNASPHLAPLAAVGTGLAAGVVVGALVAIAGLPSFIVTLGMLTVLRGLAVGLANKAPVYPDRDGWERELLQTTSNFLGLPAGVWIMFALTILAMLMMRYTRFGRHIVAIGSSESTARLCGVPIVRTRMMIFGLAGMLTGVAGLLEFSYVQSGDINAGLGLELNVIAAVVIGGASLSGGRGSILGAVVGALLMTVIQNGCTKLGLDNWVQQIVTGVIIVLAVGIDQLRRWRSRTA